MKWKYAGYLGHVPDAPIRCPICGHIMECHQSWVFKVADDPKCGWRNDVRYKCPVCHNCQWFGIPISEDEARRILATRKDPCIHPHVEREDKNHG